MLLRHSSKSGILRDAVQFVDKMMPPMKELELRRVVRLCCKRGCLLAKILEGCNSSSTDIETKRALTRISTGLVDIVLDDEFNHVDCGSVLDFSVVALIVSICEDEDFGR